MVWQIKWLGRSDRPSMVDDIKAIPSVASEVELIWAHFYTKHPKDIIDALKEMPATVLDLNLHYADFGKIAADDLANVLASLLPTLQSLNLGWLGVAFRSQEEWIKVTRQIHRGMKAVSLAGNNLSRFGANGLANIIAALPPGLKELNLDCNYLNNITSEGLVEVFKCFPIELEKLSLSGNNLSQMSFKELASLGAALPKTLKILDVSDYGIEAKIPHIEAAFASVGVKCHFTYIAPYAKRLSSLLPLQPPRDVSHAGAPEKLVATQIKRYRPKHLGEGTIAPPEGTTERPLAGTKRRVTEITSPQTMAAPAMRKSPSVSRFFKEALSSEGLANEQKPAIRPS